MNGNEKSLTIDELLAGIWRRRVLALGLTGGVLALGLLYLAVQRPTYTASAVVRVNAQELPVQLMTTTVNERIADRLTTVRNELLSRPVLGRVIQDLGLYPDVVEEKGIGAAVEALRGKLEVKVEGENAFAVTFEGNDPELVARVANRLPEVYAEQAIAERIAAADRAAAVFGAELDRIRPQVEEVEKKLAAFKAENATELPESLDSNLQQLDRLTTLTNTTLLSLADAQRRRTALAHQGAESTLDLERFHAAVNDARRELALAEATFADDAPELQTARRHHLEIRNRFNAAVEAANSGDTAMNRVDGEIGWLKETATSYQEQMQEYLERVKNTPGVGAKLAGLDRQYEALSRKWNDLLSRRVEAELARDLEGRQKASLFRIVEPAYPPSAPTAPDPISVMGISMLLALGMGLGVPGALASRDTSFTGVSDARRRLGLPVLATVPELPRGSKKTG